MVTIGVIDSGAGGAYLETQLKLISPSINIIRFKSDKFESYSNVSIQTLCNFSSYHLDYINNQCLELQIDLDCIVIACMTLSTNCLDFIKANCNVPVYDMLTVLPYITNDTTVFATPNTIKSNRFSYCIEVPCNNLSTDIEYGKFRKDLKKDLQYYVDRINILCTKKILLGCSHYSIIKQEFQEVFNPLEIIDPVEILIKIIKQVYF